MCELDCVRIYGSTSISNNSSHQFTVSLEFLNCDVADNYTVIGLSYDNGTLEHNVHFFAPIEVAVFEGQKTVVFDLYTDLQCNGREDEENIIEITPFIKAEGIIDKGCSVFRTSVECDESIGSGSCLSDLFWEPYRHKTKTIRDYNE